VQSAPVHARDKLMRKRTPIIEWQIAESEAEWERLQAMPQSASVPVSHRQHLKRYCWSVAALLLLLASAGGWVWRTEQVKAHQTAAEAMVTAQPELRTIAQAILPQSVAEVTARPQWEIRAFAPAANPSTASLTGDPATTDAWRAFRREASDLQMVEIQGDHAVAKVVIGAKNGTPVYRQTRFYLRIPTGWIPTDPDAALWGPERSLETPSFIYHFRQNDAPAVITVAPQVETLYTTLRKNFDLPLTPDAEKLVIDVSVAQSPENTRFEPHNYERFVMNDHLVVASPALYWAPVELTDADLLAQSIALPLLKYVVAQASKRHGIGSAWRPLVRGLSLWQVWELDLPLAAWRVDVVQWVYLTLPASRLGQSVALPERYPALCTTHKLWMPSP
jgi:hypothetical protein